MIATSFLVRIRVYLRSGTAVLCAAGRCCVHTYIHTCSHSCSHTLFQIHATNTNSENQMGNYNFACSKIGVCFVPRLGYTTSTPGTFGW